MRYTANSKMMPSAITETRHPNAAYRVLWLLMACLLAALMLAAFVGAARVEWQHWQWRAWQNPEAAILWHIRLPRLCLAAIVGAGLGASGAAMQGLFRNPLADPGLLGIANGAALAVAISLIAIPSSWGLLGLYSISIAAFCGGLICCIVIFLFARRSGGGVAALLLAGLAINALCGAAIGFLTYLSDDQQLRSLSFWTMGSLGGALWTQIAVCCSVLIPALLLLTRSARQLDVLQLGDRSAEYLGIDPRQLQRRTVILAALIVGSCVAVSGVIGFVGLLVPHLLRMLIGPQHRWLLPGSALLGALLLLAADTLARTVVAPAELPVGVITSLLGAPYFLYLLISQGRRL